MKLSASVKQYQNLTLSDSTGRQIKRDNAFFIQFSPFLKKRRRKKEACLNSFSNNLRANVYSEFLKNMLDYDR